MAKHEFRFVVTGVELSPEVQQEIGRAIAQAGAFALAEHTPISAITVRLPNNIWWRGIPPETVVQTIEEFAAKEAGM